MSKSKRNHKGQFVRSHSLVFIISFWVAAVASLSLVWLASRAVMSDFGSFRSCTEGTAVLTLSSCGKHSVNVGDLILLALLGLSICFSFSLLTAAWRATKKGTVIA